MTATAVQVIEQFRKLSAAERREVCELLLRDSVVPEQLIRRKSVADVAGKYRPRPDTEAKAHDRGFAEAVLQSKLQNGRE